jgi:hypothetical protein
MMPFWQLTAKDVERLRGGDGEPFRQFAVSVIRAEAQLAGIPRAAIDTESRAMRDGGVDCQVDEGRAQEPSGWLRQQSIWQFKGEPKSRLTKRRLLSEIRKPLVARRLRAGFAYRLCVADDLSTPKKEVWETWLRDEARKVAGRDADIHVLGSTSLADWAAKYPGLVLKYGPRGPRECLHLQAWKRNALEATPQYVPNPAWASTQQRLQDHCDFSKPAVRAAEAVQGAAGVGKTRLVFEVLANLPSGESLVLYAADGAFSLNVATDLANDPTVFAILVADECSPSQQSKLDRCSVGTGTG